LSRFFSENRFTLFRKRSSYRESQPARESAGRSISCHDANRCDGRDGGQPVAKLGGITQRRLSAIADIALRVEATESGPRWAKERHFQNVGFQVGAVIDICRPDRMYENLIE